MNQFQIEDLGGELQDCVVIQTYDFERQIGTLHIEGYTNKGIKECMLNMGNQESRYYPYQFFFIYIDILNLKYSLYFYYLYYIIT